MPHLTALNHAMATSISFAPDPPICRVTMSGRSFAISFFSIGQKHDPKVGSVRRDRFQRPFCHFFFRRRAKTRPEGRFRPGDDLKMVDIVVFLKNMTYAPLLWRCFYKT
jgi:hypothetical protein